MKGLFDDSGDHPDFAWDERAFKFLGEEDKREDYLMELTGREGPSAEIIARLNETAFEFLEAPIKRITGFDIPYPYFQVEEHFLPESDEIVTAIKETIDWQ